MTIHRRPLKSKGTFVRSGGVFKPNANPESEEKKPEMTEEEQAEARVQRAMTKQHALALFQSGKVKTMQEAIAVAYATSSPTLPPDVRERLNGDTNTQPPTLPPNDLDEVETYLARVIGPSIVAQATPPSLTPREYAEFLNGEPLEEGPSSSLRPHPTDQTNKRERPSQLDQRSNEYWDEERSAIHAGAQRWLQNRLMGAGLLNPNRQKSDDDRRLEKQIRHEAGIRLEEALSRHDEIERRHLESAKVAEPETNVSNKELRWEPASEPFAVAIGLSAIEDLLEDASHPDAPDAVKHDWEVIARWLDHCGGTLTPDQRSKVRKAFLGYFAIGEAPSAGLRDAFDQFAGEASSMGDVIVPPLEVRRVFDRLLATDEEIATRPSKPETTGAALESSKQLAPERGTSSQGGPKLSARKVIFLSAAWAFSVVFYVWLFSPFENSRGLADMTPDDTNRVIAICLLPLIGWLGYRIYVRLER